MSVTIHYRGRLREPARIDELTREISDIAAGMQWPYHLYEEDWDFETAGPEARPADLSAVAAGGLKGVHFVPHLQCEPVWFCFDRHGRLSSPALLSLMSVPDTGLRKDWDWVFTKTQFAGPDMHMWLVSLLRYLFEKYLADYDVLDEGGYWHTGDEKALREHFRRINEGIDRLDHHLESVRVEPDLSPKELARRLEDILGRLTRPEQDDLS